ncbi:NADPH-dependent FMN reductase [Thalassomonas haliotis]|uniref:NAD(P)H-dependent oxidoreductase n=1 Tax=Thalassomonas haliotis TaxID=485448 RepID=A0ABY7VDV3_9GAMM|nr:NAD(P)H-dependent oxidoreductase [Thalassomonas haliotis]WDE11834.1 NAD(P)H-dependent oxidoreductase [Thalassomonas haliotis]
MLLSEEYFKNTKPLNIVGLCGSLREDSCSYTALSESLTSAKTLGASVDLIDLKSLSLPYFTDEAKASDPAVKQFLEIIDNADGIIVSSPEYHGSYSGVLKNALDYLTKEQVKNKAVALISVGAGQYGGFAALDALDKVMKTLHGIVIPLKVSVSHSHKVISSGQIHSQEYATRLLDMTKELLACSERLGQFDGEKQYAYG